MGKDDEADRSFAPQPAPLAPQAKPETSTDDTWQLSPAEMKLRAEAAPDIDHTLPLIEGVSINTGGTSLKTGGYSSPSASVTSVDPSATRRTTSEFRAAQPQVGDRFADRYEILAVLGKGGMSTVYKADDTKLNRIVAVKVVHPHLMEEEDTLKRFEREAKSVGGLQHDHIVEIYTSDITDGGYPYLIMQYLDGQALSSIIKAQGRVPYQRAVPIFMQIADALAHAHAKGVIHRDLKPSNVLLSTADNTDSVGVVDFGLAKFMPHSKSSEASITATGQVFGSPPYMSPEQCVGKKIDERSDIYSLGCLMYETITGETPFTADTPVATVMKQIGEIPQPPSKVVPAAHIPPLLEALILKSLEKDPKARQQSMDELLSELKTLVSLEQSGLEFKPVTTGVKLRMMWKQNRTMLIVMTVLILGLVGFIYSAIIGWIDSYYDYDYRWLKIIICWVVGIGGVIGFWRVRKFMKEVTAPEIGAVIPGLAWDEPKPSTPAEIDALRTKLNALPQLLENVPACSDRTIQQQVRDSFQVLLSEKQFDDVEKYASGALDILRAKQRDNSEIALLFREFLADSLKARGQSDRAEVSYREIMGSWQSSDDFSRGVRSTVQLKLADSLRAQKKYTEAQAIYSVSLPSIAADPFSAVHYGKLGDCYLSIGNYKLAGEQYQKVMSVADKASNKINSELGFIKYAYTCHKTWKPLDVKRDFAKSVGTIDDAFGRNSSHYFVAMSVYATEMWNEKRFLAAINAHKEAKAKIPMISAAS